MEEKEKDKLAVAEVLRAGELARAACSTTYNSPRITPLLLHSDTFIALVRSLVTNDSGWHERQQG